MIALQEVVPSRLWHKTTATTIYNSGGGRDVLILAPDLSRPHHEAVTRRSGKLTQEDMLKLQSQGLLLAMDCEDELAIVKARYEVALGCEIFAIKSGQSLSREGIMESIEHLLNTTESDGGILRGFLHSYTQ